MNLREQVKRDKRVLKDLQDFRDLQVSKDSKDLQDIKAQLYLGGIVMNQHIMKIEQHLQEIKHLEEDQNYQLMK